MTQFKSFLWLSFYATANLIPRLIFRTRKQIIRDNAFRRDNFVKERHVKLLPILGLLIGMWLPVSAAAAPVFYDEAVSGDLDGSKAFTLDDGVNVFLGTVQSGVDGRNNDLDLAQFFMSRNSMLVRATLYLTDIGGTGLPLGLFQVVVPSPDVPGRQYRVDWRVPTPPPPFGKFSSDLDFVAIPGLRNQWALGYDGFVKADGKAEYRVELELAPIPLPTSLTFGATGIMALAFARRRKMKGQR